MARSNGQPNFKTLIRDELVTRFENVIVDEINYYKSNIKKTEYEIEKTRELVEKYSYYLDIIKTDQNLKSGKLEQKIQEINERLEVEFLGQNKKIYESIHEINLVKLSVTDGLDCLSTKHEIVDFKEEILAEIGKLKQFAIDNDKICTDKLSRLFEEQQKMIHEFLFVYNHELEELKKEIETLKTQISLFFVETAGVKKEMNIVKKEAFIREKKIEQIYTLIDRTKKGGKNVTSRSP